MRAKTPRTLWLIATAVAWIGCGGAIDAPPQQNDPGADGGPDYPQCHELEARARKIWGPEIRGELDFSVRIFEGEILASDAELAVNRLDEFTEAWVKLAVGACESHAAAGTLEGEEYTSLLRCLAQALETQRAIIDAMRTGGKAAIAQAQTLPEAVRVCSGEASAEGVTVDMRDNPFGGRR
jgi:hypothetical protein